MQMYRSLIVLVITIPQLPQIKKTGLDFDGKKELLKAPFFIYSRFMPPIHKKAHFI